MVNIPTIITVTVDQCLAVKLLDKMQRLNNFPRVTSLANGAGISTQLCMAPQLRPYILASYCQRFPRYRTLPAFHILQPKLSVPFQALLSDIQFYFGI